MGLSYEGVGSSICLVGSDGRKFIVFPLDILEAKVCQGHIELVQVFG